MTDYVGKGTRQPANMLKIDNNKPGGVLLTSAWLKHITLTFVRQLAFLLMQAAKDA
jgi:hypothetical protein